MTNANNKGERGHPCLVLLPREKNSVTVWYLDFDFLKKPIGLGTH